MSTAARLSERIVNIRLLSCFDFLSAIRGDFPYPVDFKLATLKQFVQSNLQQDTKRKFGFKIFKTFFSNNKRSVQEMHKLDPQTVEDFIHFMNVNYPLYEPLMELVSLLQGHSTDVHKRATCSLNPSTLRAMFDGLRNQPEGFQHLLSKLDHFNGKLTIY